MYMYVCMYYFGCASNRACRILVPRPRIQTLDRVKAQDPHHWITREFPPNLLIYTLYSTISNCPIYVIASK